MVCCLVKCKHQLLFFNERENYAIAVSLHTNWPLCRVENVLNLKQPLLLQELFGLFIVESFSDQSSKLSLVAPLSYNKNKDFCSVKPAAAAPFAPPGGQPCRAPSPRPPPQGPPMASRSSAAAHARARHVPSSGPPRCRPSGRSLMQFFLSGKNIDLKMLTTF